MTILYHFLDFVKSFFEIYRNNFSIYTFLWYNIDKKGQKIYDERGEKMQKLKQLRNEKGLTQAQLAKEIEITQKQISTYEVGNAEPDISTLIKFADFFDTTIDYLVGRALTKQPTIQDVPVLKGAIMHVNDAEFALVADYRRLPDKIKPEVIKFIDFKRYELHKNSSLAEFSDDLTPKKA